MGIDQSADHHRHRKCLLHRETESGDGEDFTDITAVRNTTFDNRYNHRNAHDRQNRFGADRSLPNIANSKASLMIDDMLEPSLWIGAPRG